MEGVMDVLILFKVGRIEWVDSSLIIHARGETPCWCTNRKTCCNARAAAVIWVLGTSAKLCDVESYENVGGIPCFLGDIYTQAAVAWRIGIAGQAIRTRARGEEAGVPNGSGFVGTGKVGWAGQGRVLPAAHRFGREVHVGGVDFCLAGADAAR